MFFVGPEIITQKKHRIDQRFIQANLTIRELEGKFWVRSVLMCRYKRSYTGGDIQLLVESAQNLAIITLIEVTKYLSVLLNQAVQKVESGGSTLSCIE